MIAKVERYFISEDRAEITLEDRVYFYGVYISTGALILGLVGKVGFIW